jgi:chromate transporter
MAAEPTIPVAERPAMMSLLGTALLTGILGFGGGFVVLGRVRRDMVDEKRWLTPEAFLEHAAMASALPGTTATNLFSLIGYTLRGPLGSLLASVVFLLPSIALMLVFGAGYDRLRSVAGLASFFEGMGAAVPAVVLSVAVELRKNALKGPLPWAIAVVALALLVTKVLSLLSVVALSGAVGLALLRPKGEAKGSPLVMLSAPAVAVAGGSFLSLLLVFSKIGVATFGGGYAMIPEIAREVTAHGWLDDRAFADAIAFGQITPGPVAISATFVGYRVGGLAGAFAATLGIFGPPFVISLVVARSFSAFRTNPWVRAFLAGVGPAVVGIIVAAAWSVARASLTGVRTYVIAAIAMAILLWKPKTNPLFLLFGAAIAGFVAARLGSA